MLFEETDLKLRPGDKVYILDKFKNIDSGADDESIEWWFPKRIAYVGGDCCECYSDHTNEFFERSRKGIPELYKKQ